MVSFGKDQTIIYLVKTVVFIVDVILFQNKKTKSKDLFLQQSFEKFGNKFDYSKVNYVDRRTNITIICPIHGEFETTSSLHLNSTTGCFKCSRENKNDDRKYTLETFVEKANKVHNNKYDYSITKYVDNKTKICIICPIHGEFWQMPHDHIGGCGCRKCSTEKNANSKRLGIEKFIEKSRLIHGDKYDYSKVNYINNNTKVEIICPKHGSFWQTPGNHTQGSNCPKCYCSQGEEKIGLWLKNHKIDYEYQYPFDDCKYKRKLEFDFYIPSKNLCIEFDGQGHFMPINWNNKMSEHKIKQDLKLNKIRDEIKNKYCKDNNINLLRIPYTEINNIESILKKQLL